MNILHSSQSNELAREVPVSAKTTEIQDALLISLSYMMEQHFITKSQQNKDFLANNIKVIKALLQG